MFCGTAAIVVATVSGIVEEGAPSGVAEFAADVAVQQLEVKIGFVLLVEKYDDVRQYTATGILQGIVLPYLIGQ